MKIFALLNYGSPHTALQSQSHLAACVHTYIYNWPLQLFSQDYGLASHTTYVVCVNFIHEWWNLQFNIDSEWQILWETFHGSFYLLSDFLLEICWEENAEEIIFVFYFGVWPKARSMVLRRISQHTILQFKINFKRQFFVFLFYLLSV